MNKNTKSFPLITLAFLFSTPQAFAGAWTKPRGEALYISAYSYYSTQNIFDGYGHKIPQANEGKFRKQSMNLYIEYGLIERLTLVANTFYDFLEYTNATVKLTNNGFSDQEIGLRYGLWKEYWVFSNQGIVKLPAGYEKNRDLALGNAQVDLEYRILIGRSFGKNYSFYFNSEFGYRLRLEEPPDEVRWQVLLGYKGIKNLELSLAWNAIHSLGKGEETFVGKNVLNFVNYDLNRLDIFAAYNIYPRFAVMMNYFQHVFGRNTGADDGFSFGITVTP